MALIVTDKNPAQFDWPGRIINGQNPGHDESFSKQDGHDMRPHHSPQPREAFVI